MCYSPSWTSCCSSWVTLLLWSRSLLLECLWAREIWQAGCLKGRPPLKEHEQQKANCWNQHFPVSNSCWIKLLFRLVIWQLIHLDSCQMAVGRKRCCWKDYYLFIYCTLWCLVDALLMFCAVLITHCWALLSWAVRLQNQASSLYFQPGSFLSLHYTCWQDLGCDLVHIVLALPAHKNSPCSAATFCWLSREAGPQNLLYIVCPCYKPNNEISLFKMIIYWKNYHCINCMLTAGWVIIPHMYVLNGLDSTQTNNVLINQSTSTSKFLTSNEHMSTQC